MALDPKAMDEILAVKKSARLQMWLEICARCGLCAKGCHFFQSDPKPEYTPAFRLKPLIEAYRRKGRLTAEAMEHLRDTVYGTCTMCQRCAMYCPYGINIAFLVRSARAIAVSQGLVPEGLQNATNNHYEHGNNLALTEEDYTETIDWQLEELEEEMERPLAPMDKKGARTMVTFHPRDIGFYPQNVYSYLKIYNGCKEDFTFASSGWDSTNIGLFSGDDKAATHFSGLVVAAAERLGVERVCTAE